MCHSTSKTRRKMRHHVLVVVHQAMQCALQMTRCPNACRKLKLARANVADMTLAAVLQQLRLLTVRLPATHCTEATGMHALCCRCAALHHAVHAVTTHVPWRLVTHCQPISQDLTIESDSAVGANSLASMPTSLRRLTLGHCNSVPASSLTSIGRLSVLEKLALDSLPNAGGDDALQQLALHLPAGLTSLEFIGIFTEYWRVANAAVCRRSRHFYEP